MSLPIHATSQKSLTRAKPVTSLWKLGYACLIFYIYVITYHCLILRLLWLISVNKIGIPPSPSAPDIDNLFELLYPPRQQSCWRVYWFQSVRLSLCPSVHPSVHPSCILCQLCSTYSSGWIHFIFIHLIKQLQKVCSVQRFLKKLKHCDFCHFFLICNFYFVFFWLGIWCESLV